MEHPSLLSIKHIHFSISHFFIAVCTIVIMQQTFDNPVETLAAAVVVVENNTQQSLDLGPPADNEEVAKPGWVASSAAVDASGAVALAVDIAAAVTEEATVGYSVGVA